MKLPGYSTNKYLFFWGKKSPYSQHYRCEFYWFITGTEKIKFTSAEQFMMYRKAKLFKNDELADDMLAIHEPSLLKNMGRRVVGFNDFIWISNREDIVTEGNMNKFYQNAKLFSLLLLAGNRTFVEASPYDKIWGIGKSIDDPYLLDEKDWGQNLLGQILTNVKDYAISDPKKTMLF